MAFDTTKTIVVHVSPGTLRKVKQSNRGTGWTFLVPGLLIVLFKKKKHQGSESCTNGGAPALEGPSRVIKPKLLDGSSWIEAQSQSRSFARYLLGSVFFFFLTSRSLVPPPSY